MKKKIIFAIVSCLPIVPSFFLFKFAIYQSRQGTDYWLGFGTFLGYAILIIAWIYVSSIAITIGGIIHTIREKRRGEKIGYYLIFTLIAALPLFYALYKTLEFSIVYP